MSRNLTLRTVFVQRREFIKASAMAAAAAIAGGTSSALPILGDESATGIDWQKAPCRFCGTGCHVQVGVQQGKIVAIAGDRNADVNKGLLCVKGYHVGQPLMAKIG